MVNSATMICFYCLLGLSMFGIKVVYVTLYGKNPRNHVHCYFHWCVKIYQRNGLRISLTFHLGTIWMRKSSSLISVQWFGAWYSVTLDLYWRHLNDLWFNNTAFIWQLHLRAPVVRSCVQLCRFVSSIYTYIKTGTCK